MCAGETVVPFTGQPKTTVRIEIDEHAAIDRRALAPIAQK